MLRPEVYGDVLVGAIPSVHADHIRGFRVGRGPAGEALGIELQYERGGNPKNITIALTDAIALLALLKCFQLNEALPFPDDPRDPTWRAGINNSDGSRK